MKAGSDLFTYVLIAIFTIFVVVMMIVSGAFDQTSSGNNNGTPYQGSRGSENCTVDCSGHEAGYSWANRYEICDRNYSNGNSHSFNQGVRAWAEDNC